MKDPLAALKHSWWHRLYLVGICVLGIIVFQFTVLPRACRIALTHVLDRNLRTRNIKYSTKSPRNTLDVYRVPNATSLNPVVIFCHGGAWNSGDKLHYCTLAKTMRRNNIMTVIINYTLYPKGLIADMLFDINAALKWTASNIRMYGGDPENIYFIGHSAGAHLGSLAILQHVLNSKKQNDIKLRGFIGLAGPYDIRDHFEHEFKRGVEQLSPMQPTMGGISNFHLHSPTTIAKSLQATHLERLCSFHILHGAMDATVPVSSSIKFAKQLQEIGANAVLIEYHSIFHFQYFTASSRYKQLGHSHILFDLMDDVVHSPVLRDVLKIVQQAKYT